jgi:hypothetical protein
MGVRIGVPVDREPEDPLDGRRISPDRDQRTGGVRHQRDADRRTRLDRHLHPPVSSLSPDARCVQREEMVVRWPRS